MNKLQKCSTKKLKRLGNMKILVVMLLNLMILILIAGCAVSSSSASASAATPDVNSPSIPAEDLAPADTASAALSKDEDINKEKSYKEWLYYLDEKDPVVTDYNEDPPLHMKKADNSGDVNLGIRGFSFDIIGDYIYIDLRNPDLGASGERTWITARMNPDGSGKTELEYGCMSARLIPDGEQKFYFTSMGDSAIYISDFSCENVSALIVKLSDESEIDNKLGSEKTLQLDIKGVSNGLIDFEATFSNLEGLELYNGLYNITADGQTIKKVKGSYINRSKESEVD